MIAFESPLLGTLAVKNGGIQVQVKSLTGRGHHCQKPAPERTPKGLDFSLGEAPEKVADRIVTGKALDAQQSMQDMVSPQPLAVGKTPSAHHDGHQESHQRMSQRNGIMGSRLLKGQGLLKLRSQADLIKEGDQANITTLS